jgi:drug/metabolite transporter (DMT)-like permease
LLVQQRSSATAWIALGAVCILWGTTYLAIRIALEAFPPFYLMGFRYSLSGLAMVVGAKLWGATLPSGRRLWLTALYGTITIGFGTGLLCVAEQWVPTGLSALFVAAQPFWMVIMDWLLSRGAHKPLASTIRGLIIGIAGVAVLVEPVAIHQGLKSGIVTGFLLLQLGCAGWVYGALMQKKLKAGAHPIVSGAVQQLATGMVFLLLAGIFEHVPKHVGLRPLAGMLYLVVFGAVVGYSAFVYAMDRLPSAIVSVYTFVNPVVAVFLGWLFFREPFGMRELAAMLLIFAGIAAVKFSGTRESRLVIDGGSEVAVSD